MFAASAAAVPFPATVRVAVICDYAEENWPSMDLVGDMLASSLRQQHGLQIQQLQPSMPFAGRTPGKAVRLFGRFVHYPRELRRVVRDFDLFHIVDHSYAHLVHSLPAERTIVTCHDLDTFRCLLSPETERRSYAFRTMTQRILSGMQRARHVTCDTAATREGLLSHSLIPPDRLSVVHNGVHPDLKPQPETAADAEISRLLKREPEKSPELLHVGSTIPRKRIDVLLRVFAEVGRLRPDLRLLRVGGSLTLEQQELANSLGIGGRIDTLPRLSPPQLGAVYRRAKVLLQTSESEGFGLPVIEAMACGTPVIASDIPSLREIGANATTFCPVGNVPAWTEAVRAQLDRMPDKLGLLRHAERFSWFSYAMAMTEIYRRVLSS